MENGRLYKTQSGFSWDSEDIFTWILHYNHDGSYRGQTQSDVEGDGDIFLSAHMIDGVPHVNGKPAKCLTKEEMDSAE